MTVHIWERDGFLGALNVTLPSPDTRLLIEGAAALSVTAGTIHAFVTPEHLHEWWGYGSFFAASAVAQVGYGFWMVRRPSRRLLAAGIAGNLALVGTWALSRTAGIPIGPSNGHAEPIGALDVACSAIEVALVAALIVLLRRSAHSAKAGAARRTVAAAALATTVLAAVSAGAAEHAHGAHDHGAQLQASSSAPSHDPESHAATLEPTSHHEETAVEDEWPAEDCDAPVAHAAPVPIGNDPSQAVAIFVGTDHSIRLYDVAADSSRTVVETDPDCWLGELQAAGRTRIVFKYDNAMWLASLEDGAVSTIQRGGSDHFVGPFDVSRDGSTLAILFEDDEGRADLITMPATGGPATTVHEFTEPIEGHCGSLPQLVRFSPDGTMIAVSREPDGLNVLTRTGRVLRTLAGAEPVWLNDSSGIAYEQIDGDELTWARLDLATGEKTPLSLTGEHEHASVSPDGTTLVVDGGWYGIGTDLVDLRTGKHRRLTDEAGFPLWITNGTIAATEQISCDDCEGAWNEGERTMAIDTSDGTTRRLSLDPTGNADVLYGSPTTTEAPPPPPTADPITVKHKPAFEPVSSQTTTVLEHLSFDLNASDQDGDALTYSAIGLPPHAIFDPVSKRFSWRPRPGQEGTWMVGFKVTDATGATDTVRVRIAVRSIHDKLECALLASCESEDVLVSVPPRTSTAAPPDAGRAEVR